MGTFKSIDTLDDTANDNPARQLLDRDRCAFVAVDLQERLVPKMFNREQLISNSRLLLRLCPHCEFTGACDYPVREGTGACSSGDH